MTVVLTYGHKYSDDLTNLGSFGALQNSGLTNQTVTLIAKDVFRLTGTCDDAGDEYCYVRTPDLSSYSISTTLYPYLTVRWKTSVASAGLGAKIQVDYTAASGGGSSTHYPNASTPSFNTTWTTSTFTLTAARTIQYIYLYADDYPDSTAALTTYVDYDFLIVHKGTFTFPHSTKIDFDFPLKSPNIPIPYREGDVTQRVGMANPEITLSSTILPGETWETSASYPHFDCLLRAELDDFNWFICTRPRIKTKVMCGPLHISGDGKDLQFTLPLTISYPSNLNDSSGIWDDLAWLYTTT